MRFRRGTLHWYDLVFITLAAAIVYPDKILEWISEQTGRAFGWAHLILLAAVSAGLLTGVTITLMPGNPKLEWWHPALHVGCLGLFRVIMAFVSSLFGFDD